MFITAFVATEPTPSPRAEQGSGPCHRDVLQCVLLSTDSGLLRQLRPIGKSRTFGNINLVELRPTVSLGFSPGMAEHAPNLVV